MRRFPSASALIGATKPDIPIVGVRLLAAACSARCFIESFHGDVACACEAAELVAHGGFKRPAQSRTALRGA
jgi:hypothetical protein